MLKKLLLSSKTILTLLFFIFVYGLFTYSTLPREADPDISLPVIYVSVHHTGISPDDSERLLIKPLEKELKKIEGLKKMSSTSYLGGGNVVLEFDAGFESKTALNDVRVKVDLMENKLPQDTEEPRVTEINLSRFPVLAIALSGNLDERLLIKLSKRLKEKLEGLSEVLEVKTVGARIRQIEILVDPLTVKNYGLTANEVLESIKKANILIPAGTLTNETGSFNIRVPGLFKEIDDLLKLPIKSNEKSSVRLGDLAKIVDSFKIRQGFARNNGQSAIILEVSKRSGENIIDTIEKLKKIINKEMKNINNSIKVDYFQDESNSINSMISDLENNIILAVILVLIIIIYWMGLKPAILVSLSIPGSFLLSMILLSSIGVTINVVVLFSLILSVGILIDGAIIVVEYANRRALENNLDNRSIYILAAQKMARPVVASTLTTLAAFFPLIFWPGIAGEFMYYLPVTLLTILSSSLIMALVFIPTLGIKLNANNSNTLYQSDNNISLLESGNLNQVDGIQGKYISFLKLVLLHPVKIVLGTIFLLISIQIIYSKLGKGFEFFPPIEPDYAEIVVHARGNLSVYDKDKIIKNIEEITLKNKYVSNMYSTSGTVPGASREGAEDIVGSIKLEFVDWRKRPKAMYVINDLYSEFNEIAGIKVEIIEKKDGPPKDKDVEIEISNSNLQNLMFDTRKLLKFLNKQNWVLNLDDGLNVPGIDWELIVDREQADKYGVDISKVGNAVQMLTHGLKISEFMPEDSDEEVDIVVKYKKNYQTLDELDRLEIESKQGPISLSSFVQRVPVEKVGRINRVDSKRSVNIKFDVPTGYVANNLVKEIKSWQETTKNIKNSIIKFRGQEEDQEEAKEFLFKAFFISIFLITIILITTFEKFYYCFIILTSVIMSTIGVMIGLLLTMQPFGVIMSGIGVIALAGIVVNNNIVLLDTYKTIRSQTSDIKEAIIRTGAQRLRPVLLTTLTTFFGLIPMAIGLNINFINQEINFGSPSSQWWLQLSNAIVFGIIFSFVLTLIVTPSLIYIGERFFKSEN